MNGFSSVVVAGNLVRDPALKYTQSGTPLCEFGVAVNTRRTKGDEKIDEVSYYDVTCFGKTAEVAGQYLVKGKPVALEGRLQQQRWTTQDNQNRSKVVIIAERIHFLPDGQRHEGDEDDDQQ